MEEVLSHRKEAPAVRVQEDQRARRAPGRKWSVWRGAGDSELLSNPTADSGSFPGERSSGSREEPGPLSPAPWAWLPAQLCAPRRARPRPQPGRRLR
jgi:hypothetical protein